MEPQPCRAAVRPFRKTARSLFLLACLAAFSWACGDSGEDPKADDDSQVDEGSDGDGDPNKVELDPPEKGRGIQLSMTTRIPAATDVEHCQFVQLGDDELIVNHDEARFAGGSHHVLVYTTSYDEIPTRDLFDEKFDTSKPFDCSIGVAGFWSVTGLISASQNGNGASSISFPEGVGMRVPGKSVLLINAHYVNAKEQEIEPEILINLHTISEDELEQEGGLIFWYHPFLKIPAGGSFQGRAACPVSEDITIVNAQSHMHKLGVGYVAELFGPEKNAEGEVIYEGKAWEDVPVKTYAPMLEVRAGSHIEWQCEYENQGESDVYQGPRSFDEMCMFLGSYFPRNDDVSWCQRDGEAFMNAEWKIGDGEKTCADTFGCIVAAASMDSGETRGPDMAISAVTDCMLESDPAVSKVLSDMVGCFAASEDGEQLSHCKDEIAVCQEH